MLPLEQTDRDALTILKGIGKEITRVRAAVKAHKKGAKAYQTVVHIRDYGCEARFETPEEAEASDQVAKLKELGFTPVLSVTAEKYSYRRRKGDRYQATFKVPKGFEGHGQHYGEVKVPSYEKLRMGVQVELEGLLKALEGNRDAIKAAIKDHKANPRQGEAKKGPVVHLEAFWKGKESRGTTSYCKMWGMTRTWANSTKDHSKVTCKRCRKHLDSK
jgi:hypothetical protein